MFGYGVGYIGGLLVLPSFSRHFELDHLSKHDLATAQSAVVSIWLVGALVGVVGAMPVCSHLGRQKCLLFCAAIFVVGAALQLVPSGGGMVSFDVGRLLNGIGVGAGTLVAPLYISEISRHDHRGMLLAAWQVSLQVSGLVGFWVAYFSHSVFPDNSDLQWQAPVVLQFAPGAALLFGSFLIPESPIWLAERHDLEESCKALAWLRGQEVSSPEIVSQVEEYYQTLVDREALEPSSRGSSSKEIFRRPIRKRLICGVGLMVLMTISGTNALNFFAPTIFMSAGFTSTSASLFLTGIFGLTKLAASLGFMFYFVRVKGHRFWIIVATAVCSFALLVLAFCVRAFEFGKVQHPRLLAVDGLNIPGVLACIMVFTFAFFFGIGHGPIAWNFCAEVFPAHINTKCCAITTCTQWVAQVVNAVATPLLLASAGWYTWIIFSSVNAFTLIWCVLYIPETRGVPLGMPMDAVFGRDSRFEYGEFSQAQEVEDAPVVGEVTPLLRSRDYSR